VTDPIEEVFSLFVALVGLAGFALALALVEQIVLETNLANVSTGSRVYESGHVSRVSGGQKGRSELPPPPPGGGGPRGPLVSTIDLSGWLAAKAGKRTIIAETYQSTVDLTDISIPTQLHTTSTHCPA